MWQFFLRLFNIDEVGIVRRAYEKSIRRNLGEMFDKNTVRYTWIDLPFTAFGVLLVTQIAPKWIKGPTITTVASVYVPDNDLVAYEVFECHKDEVRITTYRWFLDQAEELRVKKKQQAQTHMLNRMKK